MSPTTTEGTCLPKLRAEETLIREPPKYLEDLEYYEGHFFAKSAKAGIEARYRVSLLHEATQWWNEKGHLMRKKLKSMGIQPREWWD